MDPTITKYKANILYTKPENLFNQCILNPENIFLENELNFDIDKIKIESNTINIKYIENQDNKYNIEVLLNLMDNTNLQIGYYKYVENSSNEVIDEFLVFY